MAEVSVLNGEEILGAATPKVGNLMVKHFQGPQTMEINFPVKDEEEVEIRAEIVSLDDSSIHEYPMSEDDFRLLTIRYNDVTRLVAFPYNLFSSSSDLSQYNEDAANLLASSFNVPNTHRIVGLEGPHSLENGNNQQAVVFSLDLACKNKADFMTPLLKPQDTPQAKETFVFDLILQSKDCDMKINPQSDFVEYINSTKSASSSTCETLVMDKHQKLGSFFLSFIKNEVEAGNLCTLQGEVLIQRLIPDLELCDQTTEGNIDAHFHDQLPLYVDAVLQGALHVACWINSAHYLSAALGLISRNIIMSDLDKSESSESTGYPLFLEHAHQEDLMTIAQVLRESGSLNESQSVALLSAIICKQETIVWTYTAYVRQMEEANGELVESKNEDGTETELSFAKKDAVFDWLIENIRKISLLLDPIEPSPCTENTQDVCSNEEDAPIMNPTSSLLDELGRAAAILVTEGRVTSEQATSLIGSHLRNEDTLVSSIHNHFRRFGDFGEFLTMLENLVHVSANPRLEDQTTFDSDFAKANSLSQIEDSLLADLSSSANNSMLQMQLTKIDYQSNLNAHDCLFDEVKTWEGIGELELTALRLSIANDDAELRNAVKRFLFLTEERDGGFRHAVRSVIKNTVYQVEQEMRSHPEAYEEANIRRYSFLDESPEEYQYFRFANMTPLEKRTKIAVMTRLLLTNHLLSPEECSMILDLSRKFDPNVVGAFLYYEQHKNVISLVDHLKETIWCSNSTESESQA